jgi:hypothetical protein
VRSTGSRADGHADLFDPADRRLPTLELSSRSRCSRRTRRSRSRTRQYEALERRRSCGAAALRHAILELSGALLATLEPREIRPDRGVQEIVD